MEGHETSDWNSYYADTQEVSRSQGLAPLLPLCKGEGGAGGKGWGSGGGQQPEESVCAPDPASANVPPPPPPLPPALKPASLPRGKHGFREPRRASEGHPGGGCGPAGRAGGAGGSPRSRLKGVISAGGAHKSAPKTPGSGQRTRRAAGPRLLPGRWQGRESRPRARPGAGAAPSPGSSAGPPASLLAVAGGLTC